MLVGCISLVVIAVLLCWWWLDRGALLKEQDRLRFEIFGLRELLQKQHTVNGEMLGHVENVRKALQTLQSRIEWTQEYD